MSPQARAAVRRKPRRGSNPLWYLLDWYMEIRSATPAGMGYQGVSYQEILAFKTLYELDLDAFDADTLRRLDTVWLKSRPKQADAPGSKS